MELPGPGKGRFPGAAKLPKETDRRALILFEELLRVFNKADDYDDGRAGHAYEEHDLQGVHGEYSEKHR